MLQSKAAFEGSTYSFFSLRFRHTQEKDQKVMNLRFWIIVIFFSKTLHFYQKNLSRYFIKKKKKETEVSLIQGSGL